MKPLPTVLLAALLGAGFAPAQEPAAPASEFARASEKIQQRLEQSLAELSALRERIAEEKIPLGRRLGELQTEVRAARREAQEAAGTLQNRTFALNELRNEIELREQTRAYLAGLIADYIGEFDSRLHIAEKQYFGEQLAAARTAQEDESLTEDEAFQVQAELLGVSLGRLEEALGGYRFEGRAAHDGLMKDGTFLLVGPTALFAATDGSVAGSAVERLNSFEPTVVTFEEEPLAQAAAAAVSGSAREMPFDPTLGDAHKIAATQETFVEHVKKGGPVMVPIFAMAGVALLIALLKWLSLAFVRTPSKRRVDALLEAVSRRDRKAALENADRMGGPVGSMLAAGAEHLDEPPALIEEVMYERMLTARLKLQRWLPFIAICAASAPLLGLLGTVTGIINTFKMITVYGSGDVKSLSGGISEALITTKFGLIVAIPSLLLHAFLSRKARSIVGKMETSAVAFVNEVNRSRSQGAATEAPVTGGGASPGKAPDPDLVQAQVNAILKDLLGPMADESDASEQRPVPAG